MPETPLITNDAVVLGILMVMLGFVFWGTSSDRPFWRKFYTYVPSLLVCYFLPSLASTAGLISGDVSNLYFVSSRYLLPTSLVLLTLSIDYKGILNLGPKALIMFVTGTAGIVIGGPLAILIAASINPEMVGGEGPEAVWRGMTTVAGSWIGGGANQTAMKEVFGVGDDIFSAWVAVDVIVANIWMAVLLFAAGRAEAIDRRTGADASAIHALRDRMAAYQASIAKIPQLAETMLVLAVGFGATAIAHVGADLIAPYLAETAPYLERFSLTNNFFWIVVIATTLGMLLAATRARQLEGVGASRVGSALLYVLIALALGLLISALVRTQRVAMMLALVITMLPAMILSGFIFPVRSMPPPLQVVAHLIPATYFLRVIRGIMLVGRNAYPLEGGVMLVMAVGLLSLATHRFKGHLE